VNRCSNSSLQFSTSKSIELTAGVVASGGVTVQGVCIENIHSGESQWFEFIGGGIGIGAGVEVGVSFSTEDFPSTGSRILEHPFVWDVNFDDLVGLGHIFTLGSSVLGGQGLSIICFGESWSEPVSANAFLVMEGMTFGLSVGAGVMCYKGHWSKVDA